MKTPNKGRTGRDLRQQIPTPDLGELSARQQALADEYTVDGDYAGLDLGPDTWGPLPDIDPMLIIEALRTSPGLRLAEEAQKAPKRKSGRPAEVSTLALLAGMFFTVQAGYGCVMSEVAKTLYYRLPRAVMDELGLRPPPKPTIPEGATLTPQEENRLRLAALRLEEALHKRVLRAVHRLAAAIDPGIHPSGRVRTWPELDAAARDLTPEQIEDRANWLLFVGNDLIRIAWRFLPEGVRDKWDGSAGIDATHMPVFARGRGVNSMIAPIEPMAGYWVRTGDHSEAQATPVKKVKFAYDAHLMVASDLHRQREHIPSLPLGLVLTRPGEDPAGAFRRLGTNMDINNWPHGYLAGDGLYANAAPETFQNPARDLGWRPILAVPDAHLGQQGVVEGFILVEGRLYCPSMPTNLIEATRDFRRGDISQADYELLIEERKVYEARLRHQVSGNKLRFGCPASGTRPTVMCTLKPASDAKDRQVFISGATLKVRDRIHPSPEISDSEHRPRPCAQDTVTIDLTKHPDAARTMQGLAYGSADQVDTYNGLRSPQEGFHGYAKDQAKENFGASGLRRVHGFAANWIMATVTLGAAGIRKVRHFLRTATRDKNGDLFILRPILTGSRARTGLPPGTARHHDEP